MKRNTILLLLMAVCSLQAVFAGSGRYDKSAYLRLTRLPTDSLLRRGTAYLSADNCEDSAMVCFRLVADRLEHENDLAPEGLRQYAKALNSIGYLYVTYYSDMEKAYRQFARSMEVARRGNLPDLLPRAYLNIGALYNFNNKYVTDGQYKSFIMDNLRRAFREAIGMKQWDVVVYSMFNMASMEKDSIRMVASDIRTFQHLDIPDTIPLLGYTRSMIRGLQAFHQGRYEEAMAAYREMLALTDQPIPNRERMELMARSEMADLLVVMGKGREAIDCLHTIIGKAASYDADDILIDAYETLSDLYLGMGDTQRADSCNYEYLKLKDAFVSRSSLQKVDRSRFLKQIEEVSAQVESERAPRAPSAGHCRGRGRAVCRRPVSHSEELSEAETLYQDALREERGAAAYRADPPGTEQTTGFGERRGRRYDGARGRGCGNPSWGRGYGGTGGREW